MTVRERETQSMRRHADYRWWVGWRPVVVVTVATFVGFAVGNAVAVPAGYFTGDLLGAWALLTVSGFVVGVGAWVWGRRAINHGWERRLSAFLDESREVATRTVGVDPASSDGERVWTLVAGTGAKPFVDAAERYSVTHFVLADHLYIHETGFDMVTRRSSDARTLRLPYDRIASVREVPDEPVVTITTTDDETFRYTTDPDRVDTLSGLVDTISTVSS